MPLTYATVEELKQYSLATLPEDEVLAKVLAIAERDVDRAAGFFAVSKSTGRKFGPSSLTTSQREGLSRATCAQAEYRLQMGEEFFIEAQPANTSGDDTNFTGRMPRFGPKAMEELLDARLVKKTGRLAHNRNDRSYPDNFQMPLSQTSSNSYAGEND